MQLQISDVKEYRIYTAFSITSCYAMGSPSSFVPSSKKMKG